MSAYWWVWVSAGCLPAIVTWVVLEIRWVINDRASGSQPDEDNEQEGTR